MGQGLVSAVRASSQLPASLSTMPWQGRAPGTCPWAVPRAEQEVAAWV